MRIVLPYSLILIAIGLMETLLILNLIDAMTIDVNAPEDPDYRVVDNKLTRFSTRPRLSIAATHRDATDLYARKYIACKPIAIPLSIYAQ